MDYIDIISKEAVTSPPDWCYALTLGICVLIAVIGFIVSARKHFMALVPTVLSGMIAIIVEVALIIVFTKFLSVPTGFYKYEATIDKTNITVSEYEDFIKTYNPEIREGIYYWTGEEIE